MPLRSLLFDLATSERWERTVRAAPGGEQLAQRLAARYVAGTAIEDALACAQLLHDDGLGCSIDCFGERVEDPAHADRVADAYVALAAALEAAEPDEAWLSIDLSHIGLGDVEGVRRRLERIAAALPAGRRLQVGAEEEHRTDAILDAVLAVAGAGGALTATVQANLRRAPDDAARLAEAGVPIRLVKGAYVESPDRALAWGEPTDLAYLEIGRELQAGGATLALATHDGLLREALLPGGGAVEMLLGVRGADAATLAARGVPVRIYVPYGDQWFRYAMRRWAESRGARGSA